MMRHLRDRARLLNAAFILVLGTSSAALLPNTARGQATYDFDLPVQPLADSLRAVGSKAGVNVVFDPAVVRGKQAPALRGALSVDSAVARLLQGSHLLARTTEGGSLLVLDEATAKGGETRPKQLGDAGQALPSDVEEIVVTAQKREERLKDVPVPVTVVKAEVLADYNQVRLRDYFVDVPGFHVTPNYVATQNLIIRGITTGSGSSPTVGVVIDDVPFGVSFGPHGNHLPDVDPGELTRIEVLRGPQGTLYGADAMGGLVKFVTTDPSTAGLSGRMEMGTSGVTNGAEPGYDLRGSVNLPIDDTLAIRASAFTEQLPGYIDDPVLRTKGVNETKIYGGRISALWRPSDNISLKLSGLYQDDKAKGLDEVDVLPGLGSLQQISVPGVGSQTTNNQAYSAILKGQIGNFDLTSLTGYNIVHGQDSLDYSFVFGPRVAKIFSVSGAPYLERNKVTQVSEEIRAATTLWQILDLQVGGFYTHETDQGTFNIYAENPITGQNVGLYWYHQALPGKYDEYAVFADLTYHVTDQLDVQIGGRQSEISEAIGKVIATGPFVGPTPQITPQAGSNAEPFTYLVTPQFKMLPDFMVYARFASGFRPGTPNLYSPGVPRTSNPDMTHNYEIGLKGDFFNEKLSLDASLYYIDWKNIQIQLTHPISRVVYSTNGSGAKSEGVEMSATARPLPGLSIEAWGAYDNAVLTQAFPTNSPVYGVPGDRLPYAARYSGSLSLNQDFPVLESLAGFVGGQVSYVGDSVGVFVASPHRQNFPAYTRVDLHAGMKFESWTANLYVNNVTDERALVNGGIGYFYPAARIYITPRTVGLNIVKTF